MKSAIQILSNPSMSSSLESKTGMIAPKQSRQKQRVVIEFLLTEGETAQNISKRLKQVYGDGAIDYSTVTRWVKRINDGQEEPAESDLCNRPRIGRPFSARSYANIDQAEVVKTAVRKWLKTQSVEFYNEGICALVKRWEKAVRKAGDYIEK